tara:strand:+ start:320 stop:1087 length:768 start_codon:yes stop_codon:yes gene_type:complete
MYSKAKNFTLISFILFSCIEKQSPLIIGHRGAKGYVAENTIPSVNYAIDLGANGVEIDVFRCKSGEIVVFHDNNLSKILDVNLCIEDLDLKKIKSFRIENKYFIPTLEEILSLQLGDLILNIELKGKGTAIPTIEILKNYFNKDLIKEENLLISSFDWDELLILRSVSQEIPIGVLIDGNPLLALKFAEEVKATSINSDYKFLNKNNIELINSMGYKLFPYTVNDKDEMKKLISLGVDGIITDYPDKLKNILNNF